MIQPERRRRRSVFRRIISASRCGLKRHSALQGRLRQYPVPGSQAHSRAQRSARGSAASSAIPPDSGEAGPPSPSGSSDTSGFTIWSLYRVKPLKSMDCSQTQKNSRKYIVNMPDCGILTHPDAAISRPMSGRP